MNCKTCKYWGKPNAKHMARCDFPDTMTAEKHIKDGSWTGIEIEATAHDDSGLEASLMTGENFGCIHYTLII